MSQVITNPNPQDLTFPYPLQGGPIRKPGDGCLASCVHILYCPAIYWFMRYKQRDLTKHMGIKCESWSNNPADRITEWTDNDTDEVDYQFIQGIGSEANRNGMTLPTTAGRYP